MAVYLISSIDVLDEDRYEEYREAGQALMDAHGGRYLVSGGETTVLRGDWTARRLTIVEFPDRSSVDALFASDGFARFRELAEGAITGTLVRVDGV